MAVDANSYVLLGQVVGAAVAVGGPLAGVWVYLNKRFDKKADKHAINGQFQDVKNEQVIQRQHIGKLFEKLEEHSRRDEDLARQIMGSMSANHAEVLRELGKKEDR